VTFPSGSKAAGTNRNNSRFGEHQLREH